MVAILINPDGNKDGNVLNLASPAAFQEHTIYVNIRIIAAKRTGSPFFDVFVSFLIEVADRSGRDLGSPQSFGDVLDSADRYTSQVHLDQCFFYGALTASISLDDSGFERDSFQLRDMERDVPPMLW